MRLAKSRKAISQPHTNIGKITSKTTYTLSRIYDCR